MLPASFASKPDSFPALGLKGLRRNIVAIGSTPPPPVAGSSLVRASVLEQGVGEGLSSKFAGQAIGKWSVRFIAFADCHQRSLVTGEGWRGRHFHGIPIFSWR